MTSVTSVTVRVPLTIRRRGGRKMIISPEGVATDARSRTPADTAVTRGDPALVKALARAFRWKRILDDGRYSSIRELAKAENVNRAYVARVLNLTLLAPELVEAILDGHPPEGMSLCVALQPFPVGWDRQRITFTKAAPSPEDRSAISKATSIARVASASP